MSIQPTTLHDFVLNLLADTDARALFQQDPEAVLSEAGLSGLTEGDVYEILPLVLDSASIVKVDAIDKVLLEAGDITAVDHLKLITENLGSDNVVSDIAAAGGITAIVKDFTAVTDVNSTLDAVVQENDVVADVVAKVTDNNVVTKVNDVVDADVVSELDVVDDVYAKTAVLNSKDAVDVLDDIDVVKDVNIGDTVVQDVVGDVVGDVTVGQVVGDITVGDVADNLLKDGIGNGNDIDISL